MVKCVLCSKVEENDYTAKYQPGFCSKDDSLPQKEKDLLYWKNAMDLINHDD